MAIGGVNGALDFGNLASGVGGEGTGIVRASLPRPRARRPQRAHPGHPARQLRRPLRTGRAHPLSPRADCVPVDDAVRASLSQALGANEPALLALIVGIPVIIGVLFNGWQGYQDDDDDFFDTYDSVRLKPRAPDRCSRTPAPCRMRRPPSNPATEPFRLRVRSAATTKTSPTATASKPSARQWVLVMPGSSGSRLRMRPHQHLTTTPPESMFPSSGRMRTPGCF